MKFANTIQVLKKLSGLICCLLTCSTGFSTFIPHPLNLKSNLIAKNNFAQPLTPLVSYPLDILPAVATAVSGETLASFVYEQLKLKILTPLQSQGFQIMPLYSDLNQFIAKTKIGEDYAKQKYPQADYVLAANPTLANFPTTHFIHDLLAYYLLPLDQSLYFQQIAPTLNPTDGFFSQFLYWMLWAPTLTTTSSKTIVKTYNFGVFDFDAINTVNDNTKYLPANLILWLLTDINMVINIRNSLNLNHVLDQLKWQALTSISFTNTSSLLDRVDTNVTWNQINPQSTINLITAWPRFWLNAANGAWSVNKQNDSQNWVQDPTKMLHATGRWEKDSKKQFVLSHTDDLIVSNLKDDNRINYIFANCWNQIIQHLTVNNQYYYLFDRLIANFSISSTTAITFGPKQFLLSLTTNPLTSNSLAGQLKQYYFTYCDQQFPILIKKREALTTKYQKVYQHSQYTNHDPLVFPLPNFIQSVWSNTDFKYYDQFYYQLFLDEQHRISTAETTTLSGGEIAGIVFGVSAGLLLIAAIITSVYRYKTKKHV